MAQKRRKHPLDRKTGVAVFTPVRKGTEERLELRGDYRTFPASNAPGYHGTVQDLTSGTWYAVYGKPCGLPGCHCDAWVEEVPGPPTQAEPPARRTAADDDAGYRGLVEAVSGALQALFTIEG